MTPSHSTPPIILVAGHWLGAWAWDEVLDHMGPDRDRTVAVTLPGLDPDDPERSTRTLEDQASAIHNALIRSGDPEGRGSVLVAHSGANAPVSLVLDRHPHLVHRVVWVDSGPMAPGTAFAPDFPPELKELPLPSFDELEQQASLEGVSEAARDRFRAKAVPQPAPVLRAEVDLTNDARWAVPTTLVCCSISGAQVQELAGGGHPMFAEVANFETLEVVDLPTGHWPMWSRPADLARIIRTAASGTG
ncbi:alpha/beta fold hydrolase [Nesterenkonia sp. NBAIMH1]|uniref:alpha/beta fold hydrolase n=1 Tax=Nesterenkonia sp. NBAIMH1 TaxID=2600320 RepID=UPI0011B40D9E|nr:alpha/beta hydrolase [Nesterenkonia sp. NBAIMH1]